MTMHIWDAWILSNTWCVAQTCTFHGFATSALSLNIYVPQMLWFVYSNRSIQKIVFTPSIHCYYLLSCFVISLEIKFDVFCVNSESGGVCVFRLAKIPSNAPLVFKNEWKIILMTGSCWEWYKVHFYTKTLNINIMLTFSTKRFDFAWNCIKKRIAWLYTIRVIVLDLNFRKKQRVCIVLDLNFWKKIENLYILYGYISMRYARIYDNQDEAAAVTEGRVHLFEDV